MTRRLPLRLGLIGALLALAGAAAAQVPAIFKDADLKLGEKLIVEHKCNECHARKWADDGKAIYRPQGRVNTPGLLRGMMVGLVVTTFAFLGVNMFLSGLHSYGTL